EPTLEVNGADSARAYPALSWDRVPIVAAPAWNRFATAMPGTWQALWDTDTGVPSRIFGPGISMPGSVDSPELAVNYAREFLASHIELLAPGSRVDDFVVVSNHLGGGMRTIGMVQHHQGLRVLGGQVNFRFKNDRLFVVGSEALPHVQIAPLVHSLSPLAARASAQEWLASGAESAAAGAVSQPFILPVISHRSVTYHTVVEVDVATRAPLGQWEVYVDAGAGAPVARRQTLHFTSGTVRYNVPQRRPDSARLNEPARNTIMVVNGEGVVSDENGLVSWDGDEPAVVTTTVDSPLVRVFNGEGNPGEATAELLLQPDGNASWLEVEQELVAAQITTFIHSRIVKDYVRGFAPEFNFLDEQLEATVNLDQTCNAFSDGRTINFFQSSENCENTGRLADVVYHEFGHAMHAQSIIEGVGAFDGAFSEGLSDYLSATITDDPGMGRGFFYDSEPLRDVDPVDFEHRWPEDIAAIHYTGLIFAGAMWDLRQALVAKYADNPEIDGVDVANRLFYAAVQRSTSIPTSFVEVLAADDDDGDLSNGTPNQCEINETFGRRHGLRNLSSDFAPLGVQPADRAGYEISLSVGGLAAQCPSDGIVGVSLKWGLRGEEDPGGADDTGVGPAEYLPNRMSLT
ncbi:MAG: hypothetical protein AAGC55_20805, partial [Myxococcota bacterium]